LAFALGALLNKTVIVANRSGANGMIGTDAVVKAPADGYPLPVAASGPIVINPVPYANVPYNPIKDLQRV
jgi:tripartite-type tricarboxylate transporter receptor subunit TctC